MQSVSVYLLPNRIDAYTNLLSDKAERFRKVYNRNLKLYRGIDNQVDVNIKNSDQKATSIRGDAVIINIVSNDQQKTVLQKDLTIIDSALGKCRVFITDSDLQSIQPGLYQFSIVQEYRQTVSDNNYVVTAKHPLYVDSQYGAIMTVEILPGTNTEPVRALEIKAFNRIITDSLETDYYTSGIIYARPEFEDPQKIHTFQMYFTDFTGNVVIQGSLSQGGNPETWADIVSIDYTNETVSYANVIGKYNWFRFKYTPDTAESGTLDKILYR
jgi:hypothetical protein